MSFAMVHRGLPGVVGFCLALSTGWGTEGVGQWTRGGTGSSPPFWMSPAVWTEQAGMEIWKTEIRPNGSAQGVLLSAVFRAQPGGFVRVIWKSATESVTLSADLTEGDLFLHQRSLWIDPSRVAVPGQIWIEAKGAALERVRLELMNAVGWGAGQHGEFVQTTSGRLLRAGDLYGDAFCPERPENGFGVIETLLHPGPVLIQEHSARMTVPLAEKVDYARLEFWVAGLAADETVLFSLNEGPFEELRPDAPRLEDPGYQHDRESGRTELAGWRRVVRFIPGPNLNKGGNTFWFGSGGTPNHGEVILRDLRLQAVFAATDLPEPVGAKEVFSRDPVPVPVPPETKAGLSFRSEGVGLRP